MMDICIKNRKGKGMVTRFAVVSDPVRKTMGGIENHARILCDLLSSHGYNVTIIEYDKLRIRDIEDYDVVVIEGIQRKTLLKTILMRKRSRMLLFTHGSFYLTSAERKELRKFDSSKEFFFKIIFDKIFIKMIFKRFDKIITLSDSESRDLLKQFEISECGTLFYDLPILNRLCHTPVQNRALSILSSLL